MPSCSQIFCWQVEKLTFSLLGVLGFPQLDGIVTLFGMASLEAIATVIPVPIKVCIQLVWYFCGSSS